MLRRRRKEIVATTAIAAVAAGISFAAALALAEGPPTGRAAQGHEARSAGHGRSPDHHTITVTCPGTSGDCAYGNFLIATSDGGSWLESFRVPTAAPVAFTFTGLSGGHNALDLADPNVLCKGAGTAGDSAKDRVSIVMGAGATVTGGPISPETFTVPAGVTASFTARCS